MGNRVVVPDIWEIEVHGAADPGEPNKERVYLRAATEVELGQYFLMVGWRLPDGSAIPLQEVFWLSRSPMKVTEGYWIVVYTGAGEQKMTTLTTGEPCLVLHLGKPTTLFNVPNLVPVLFRLGSIKVGHQITRGMQSLT